MPVRLLPAVVVGVLFAGGTIVSVQACSSFDEQDEATDSAADVATTSDTSAVDSSFADAPPADAAPFCAAQGDAAFCADFETPPLDHGWDGKLVSADAGVLELLDGGAAASAAPALGALVAADPEAPPLDAALTDAAAERSALLVKEFAAFTAKKVSVDLDLRVDALPTAAPDALAAVVAVTDVAEPTATGEPSVFFSFRPDTSRENGLAVGLSIDPTGSTPSLEGKPILPLLHTWFHAGLIIDRSTNAVTLQIDGNDVLVHGPTTIFATANVLQLSAGVFGFVNRQDMSVAVDNVVVHVIEP